MATKDTITSLGVQDKKNLLDKSAKVLPTNPSDKGFSAAQVKAALYEPALTNFLFLQRLITELKTIFDNLDSEIDTISGNAEPNVIEGVQVDGTDLTVTNKKVNVVISGKVDKVANANKVYITDDTGAQSSAGYDDYVDGNFVRRNDANQVYVPATPTANTHAASKGYVDSAKSGAENVAKLYTDGKVARSNLESVIGEASTSLNGLMSSTDKTRLNTLYELLGSESDANSVVDTITEVLAIFAQYPEGADLVSALALKLDKSDVYDGLDSDSATKAASAKQAKALKTLIDGLSSSKADANNVYTKSEINALIEGFVFADIDEELDDESENPVQNKVVKEALDGKLGLDEYSGSAGVGYADLAKDLQTEREIDDPEGACPEITLGSAGGDAEIQTGFQSLEEIYGKTVKWKQLVQNGNFEDNTTGWSSLVCSYAVSNNIATITPSGIHSSFRQSVSDVIGHKYLYVLNIKYTNGETYVLNILNAFNTTLTGTGNWETKVGIITSPNNTNNQVNVYDYDNDIRSPYQLKNFKLFDLTNIYGAGKEPTTLVEFLRDYPNALSADFNAGQLISSKLSSIDFIGQNEFDGEMEKGGLSNGEEANTDWYKKWYIRSKNFIPIIAGETYHLSETDQSIMKNRYIAYYDGDKNYLTTDGNNYGSSAAISTAPENASFAKIMYYTDNDRHADGIDVGDVGNIQFRLYWDTPNVPYKDYFKQTVQMPNIVLRSVGDVADVAYSSGGGKRRIGVVDLGTLNWSYNDAYNDHCYIAYLSTAYSSTNVPANILCGKYPTIKNSDQLSSTKGISNLEKYIRITDSNFVNDLTNFKNSLSGVYLYYELASETDIPTSENAGWEPKVFVDNYGVIKMNSSESIIVPQPYYVKYVVSLGEFTDSLYERAGGIAGNVALVEDVAADKTELQGVDTQLLNAVVGTLKHCLSIKASLSFENIGEVLDLSEQNWIYENNYFRLDRLGTAANPLNKKNGAILCSKYPTSTEYHSVMGDKHITCRNYWTDNNIIIKDSSYTDLATFKASLKNVLLVYEKA